ncbi:precorrin-3B C(17)-methyltransferase [Bartonella sp. LJL80]
MHPLSFKNPAVFIFSENALQHALTIAARLNNVDIYSTRRVPHDSCTVVDTMSNAIVQAFQDQRPIIAFCSTGIVIRLLAPLLKNKFEEPPVLCISEDAATVVPLLGGACGANDLAYKLSDTLKSYAAITTSGPLRFGINLLTPPDDLELMNREHASGFISALLAGASVSVIGEHPWFQTSSLPLDSQANLRIVIEQEGTKGNENTLVYRSKPNKVGVLSVIGLGPGNKKYLTSSARTALASATDIFGYDYYIKLAGPYAPHQTVHPSNNREELDRSNKALQLAATGRNVAIVSSGDPGIFAMAAAVMECIELSKEPAWKNVCLQIEPGITAAQSAASQIGAPLGHDFAVISLSNNLKAWDKIEERLISALKADMVMALYNPVSRARPHQIYDVIALLRQHCPPDRLIMVGTDVTREGEITTITELGELDPNSVTSRSVVIVGSSQTRKFNHQDRLWAYTPRSYPFGL